jgi:hypothetical protein
MMVVIMGENNTTGMKRWWTWLRMASSDVRDAMMRMRKWSCDTCGMRCNGEEDADS